MSINNIKYKKTILCFSALAILIAIVSTTLFSERGKPESVVLYAIDSNLYAYVSDESYLISDTFYNVDVDNLIPIGYSHKLTPLCRISENGQYLYYVEINNNNLTSLFCKNLHNIESTSIKIADNVANYQLNTDGTIVTYSIVSDNTLKLYQRDISKNNHIIIAENPKYYYAYDSDTVCYTIEDAVYKYSKGTHEEIAPKNSFPRLGAAGVNYFLNLDKTQHGQLYFYDGEKSNLLSENANVNIDSPRSPNNIISFISVDEGKPIWNIAVNDKLTKLDTVNVMNNNKLSIPGKIYVANGGKTIYFSNIPFASEANELCRVNIENGKASPAIIFDTEIDSFTDILSNGSIMYYKKINQAEHSGELYINGILVSLNAVTPFSINGIERTVKAFEGSVYFYSLSDSKSINDLILNVHKNGETYKISDNVHDFTILPNGKILYMNGFDLEKKSGTLYIFDGDTSLKIADDVGSIVHTTLVNIDNSYLGWYTTE